MATLIRESWALFLPLFLLSTAALAVITERTCYFFSIRPRRWGIFDQCLVSVQKGDYEEFQTLSRRERSPEVVLMRFAVSNRAHTSALLRRVDALFLRHVTRMESRVEFLSVIANLATLTGLLGTVTGMIRAFFRMQETGTSDPYVLAGGIAQALLSTAVGLGVAIPSLLAHNLFVQLIERHCTKMELLLHEVRLWNTASRPR